MAGSPESTLSEIGSWSVSSNGNTLSPPTTSFGAKNDTWDLIFAAAEVARFKMSGEGNKYINQQGRGLLGSVRSQNSDTAPKNHNIGYLSSQNTGHSVSQMNQVLKPRYPSVWERQQVKLGLQAQSQSQPRHQRHHPQPQAPSHYQQQQIQSRNRAVTGYENGRCVRPVGLPQSAWPPLEVQSNPHNHHQPPRQRSGTGMRAVFLGGPGAKRECAGTGVFLPRRYGNPTESEKKSACSTVLLPAKVVQALNLNFEDKSINGHSHPRLSTCFPSDYDAMTARRNALLVQQKKNLRHENVINHEVRLPQEWTY